MSEVAQIKGVLCVSAGVFGVIGIYIGLSIQRFIVKRYEVETGLSKTIYFSKLMPFAKNLPEFFSSPLYIGHLLSSVWGWKVIKYIKMKKEGVYYYNDINNPEEVTDHFSKKEILRVKTFMIVCFIIVAHILVYYFLGLVWPPVFD